MRLSVWLFSLVVAFASSAPAQQVRSDSAIEAMTRSLASELRCPVCQGLSIGDSPSELAGEMRDVIRDQLKAGKTRDEVRQYFIQKYGEWILLSPEPSGFNLLVYAIPVAFLLTGGWVVWRFVRRWSSTPSEPPPAPDTTGRV